MRFVRLLPLGLLAACGDNKLVTDAARAIDAPVIDAPGDGADIDAMVDTPPGATCVGSYKVVCALVAPTTTLTVNTAATVDTDTDCDQIVPQTDGPELCIQYFASATISSTLRVVGARPFLLATVGNLTITATGRIAANSPNGGGPLGPDGNDPTCVPGTVGADLAAGGGGGAGGTFGGAGGTGGTGGATLGAGGAPSAALTAFPNLVGGCAGSHGGNVVAGGGNGGGAVGLVAGGTLSIAGVVLTSGAGGVGGTARAGGGGGGSGGMISLDAPAIDVAGKVVANGGGGGGGGGTAQTGTNGTNGNDTANAATGGAATQGGGAGGDGSSQASATGTTGANGTAGGGGGGGGAGAILVFGDDSPGAGLFSPPFTAP